MCRLPADAAGNTTLVFPTVAVGIHVKYVRVLHMLPLLRWDNMQKHYTNPAPTFPKHIFVPLLILWVRLFPRNRGCGTRQKKLQRSSEYHERLAELDIVHDQAFANSEPPSTPTPPLSFAGSPSPPPPAAPHAPRAVRRLNITMGSHQTADPAARPRWPSLELTANQVEEAECSRDSDAVAPALEGSPEVWCSQVRLHEYKLSGRYPTPPPAPPKDQYIPPSESDAERSDSKRPRPPAKVFRKGHLMYHKAYCGPRPITYVDTRLYQGGRNDYIEAFNDDDLVWVRTIRDLLDAHNIPQRND